MNINHLSNEYEMRVRNAVSICPEVSFEVELAPMCRKNPKNPTKKTTTEKSVAFLR